MQSKFLDWSNDQGCKQSEWACPVRVLKLRRQFAKKDGRKCREIFEARA